MGFKNDLDCCFKANDREIKRLKQRIKYTQNKEEKARLQKELDSLQAGRPFIELFGAIGANLFK